ncbi:aryl-alcohol dehydrogenase-like predicted oxidoreductase [Fontibacillus solani]|uniref:Aryl-alcohol dehydrogenase-like predicted oxidoreductase n=1 Tax=Fontibacillus solani TaxID=1572857 RepID=A0A7W3XU16_9BACL|nr:aldo/keto reductase [Fontibacillus solani]MBA9088367.1 aryl-alcohol dehydrogenase-like predicted oxidoreductase [Fontibacillus solani]
MEYIKVKGIEKPVSKLVMGTAWFAPDFEDEIFKMLDVYVEQGGNVIDIGRFYGIARSEKIVKKWLEARNNRKDLIIIDKCCHPIITPDGVHHPEYWRVKPDLITDDLHYSLLHTGCDYFDLYLLHRDDPKVPVSEIIDRLESHREEGLIGAYGVSNWELPRVQEAMEYCESKGYQGLSVNNPSYSLAEVRVTRWPGCVYADDAYAKWHQGKDITLFSWAAQAHGFFADVYPRDGSAPQDIQAAFFYDDNFERLKRAQEIANEKGVDSINIALAYVLSQPFDVATIIGSRSRKEFDSCIQTLDIKLTSAELAYLNLETDYR